MTLQTLSQDQLYWCEAGTEVVLNHVLISYPPSGQNYALVSEDPLWHYALGISCESGMSLPQSCSTDLILQSENHMCNNACLSGTVLYSLETKNLLKQEKNVKSDFWQTE